MRNFFLRVFATLTGLSSKVWAFIEPVLKSSAHDFLEQALPTALGIVAQLATQGNLSNADKRSLAVNQLRDSMARAGIDAATSALNLAIELAVARLKTGA